MASLPKPKKGILKSSSSFDKADHHHGKEMKWDEMNILATHHPPDKDYGHIKIDEPPTPYSKYSDQEDEEGEGDDMQRRGSYGAEDIDPTAIASKLEGLEGQRIRRVSTTDDSSEEEEEELTEEEKAKKKKFEQKRKLHYNEFQAVKLAKQLMAEEDEDEDEEEDKNKTESSNVIDSNTDKDVVVAMQTDSTDQDVNRSVGISSKSAESSSVGESSSSPNQQSSEPTQKIERETEIF